MFNPKHLRHLRACSTALGLDFGDTLRWLWSYYASRLRVAGSGPAGCVQISIPNGADKPMRLVIRKNGIDLDVVEEVFIQKIYQVKLDNVRRVLDLGGNIGLAALFFARKYADASICTVEPIPDNLAVLKRNLELNAAVIRVVPAAAGAEDGQASFEISSDPRQHSTANGNTVMALGDVVEVDVKSVPSLMRLLEWDDIDLLKIDIEGSETEVLGGRPSWLRKVRAIIGEGHVKAAYDIEACRRDLEPMGFEVQLLIQMEGSMLFFARRAA